jgi:hypothetical protein
MADTKINDKNLEAIDKRIAELEREKLEIKSRIEALMTEMSTETRIESLKRRRYEVGSAPNDLPID